MPVIEALYLNGKCYFYNTTALKEFSFASNNFIDAKGIQSILREPIGYSKDTPNYRKIIDKYYNLDSNIKNYVVNI